MSRGKKNQPKLFEDQVDPSRPPGMKIDGQDEFGNTRGLPTPAQVQRGLSVEEINAQQEINAVGIEAARRVIEELRNRPTNQQNR